MTETPKSTEDNTSGEPELLHSYDGIQEYDNPLPAWWVWIFWITIIWGVLYYIFATLTGQSFTPESYLESRIEWRQNAMFSALDPNIGLDGESIVDLAKRQEMVDIGGNLFASKCASCHGSGGNGDSGPNLTDSAYIHIANADDISDVLLKGRAKGAMPAWDSLTRREIAVLSAYVASLRDTNAPGGSSAQGELFPEW